MSVVLYCAVLVLAAEPLDFDTDVLPVLTRAGCNAAACHGAAAGRGGFKLSLFAGDPAADHEAIVRELEGRRVDLARPGQSLLILKPTEELDHGGGQRLEPDSSETSLLASWVRSGAPRLKLRQLVKLELTPREAQFEPLVEQPSEPKDPERHGGRSLQIRDSQRHSGRSLQMRVMAVHSDGLRREVTTRAVYLPADPAAVEVSASGTFKILRPGRHTVVVRYLHLVDTVQLTVPLNPEPIEVSKQWRENWIDDEVLATLAALRIPLAPRADDAALLRRLTLDLTGRLPTPDEVRSYLGSKNPRKFTLLVDRLLASPEFVEYFSYQLGKTLRIGAVGQDRVGAGKFQAWLFGHLQVSTPLDRMARELITAEGDSHTIGAANFHRVARDARTEAEYLTESLLGVRLRCANCHNHPLDRWTQDDYHGLAAVFARLDRGQSVKLLPRGEVTHPRSGEPAVPRLPGERFLPVGEDGRAALAAWTTAKENPYFAKAAVNRLWKGMFGRGLIEPADDLRATNPATHPALLDRLAADFQEHGHDLRHTLRLLANSETYARGRETNKLNRADDRYYSHALDRPLEAEVLADALADVTGVANLYGREPFETRAILLVGPQVESSALDILGRCGRDDTCASSDSSQRNLATRLHLINGPLINQKLGAEQGTLTKSLAAGNSNEQLVEEFYLRALSRFPNASERAYWKTELAAGEDAKTRRQKCEDFLWSLLTCREFGANH